jgi:tol-pal system protein YbgF
LKSNPRLLARGAALIFLWGGASACLTSSQATRLQKDLDDVKRQVFQIQQETTGAKRSMDEVTAALSTRKEEATAGQAGMQATLQSLLDQMLALSEQVKQLNDRVSTLSAESSGSRSARPGQSSGGSGGGSSDPTFRAAYADYSKGSYDMALAGFTEFLRAHPDHADAQQAQYWIGECLFSQKRYPEAIDAFDKAITRAPAGERAAVASLKKGLAQLEAGQSSQGVATLQKLVEKYPRTEEAGLASDKLRQLGLRSPR